jgi:hypothetical protein
VSDVASFNAAFWGIFLVLAALLFWLERRR